MYTYETKSKEQASQKKSEAKDNKNYTKRVNDTGIPDAMKAKVETISGFSFDNVRVHYNSDKPAQLRALAYTQANQVHIAPGQEKHLGHELGHVIQQKQRKVDVTTHLSGFSINDDPSLERDADHLEGLLLQSDTHSSEYKSLNKTRQQQSDLKNVFNSGQIIQRLDEGAPNPYERGYIDSPKVHHIIPHSHLIDKHNEIINQGTQTLVKKRFMPDANKLTIRQLGFLYRNWRFTHTEGTYRHNDITKPWVEAPLTSNEAVTITNAPFANVSAFITAYNNYKNSVPDAPPITGDQAEVMVSLSDSYYLWPAGNLFYGEDHRIEPGGVNQNVFDSDAKYFRGETHVDTLKQLHTALMSAQGDANIRNALFAIADHVKNAGIGPMNDHSKWIRMTGDMKTAFLRFNVGTRAEYLRTHDGVLPKDFIQETIAGPFNISDTTIHSLLIYTKAGGIAPNLGNGFVVRREARDKSFRVTITFYTKTMYMYSNYNHKMQDIKNELSEMAREYVRGCCH